MAADSLPGDDRPDAEVAESEEVLLQIAGGDAREAGEDERDAGLPGRSGKAETERVVAGETSVFSRSERLRPADADLADAARFGPAEAGVQRTRVGVDGDRVLRERLLDPAENRVERALKETARQAEREEVPAPVRFARHQRSDLGEGFAIEPIDRHKKRAVGGEDAVLERVVDVAGLHEFGRHERVAVGDEQTARRQVGQMKLERGRVHGDERVEPIADGMDRVIGEADLKRVNRFEAAVRRPDLARQQRDRVHVVADPVRCGGELQPGEKHAVARVAGEAERDGVASIDGRGRRDRRIGRGLRHEAAPDATGPGSSGGRL